MTPGSGATRMTLRRGSVGRRVALDMHRQPDPCGRRLGGRHQLEIVLQPLDRRQEDAEASVARFDGDRRAHRAVDIAETLLDPLLARLGRGERGDPLGALPLGRRKSGSGPRGSVGSASTT